MVSVTNSSHDWLLIANGEPIPPHKLQKLAKNKLVMVLDGGYQQAKQAGLKIDVLLGDFDSIHPDDLREVRLSETKVINAPDQNKTDLEKGLHYIDEYNPTNIYICAATGLRLQHTLYNLRILKKYHHTKRNLTIVSSTEIIRYYQNTEFNIVGNINDCVALLGFPYATITTSGLKYDVREYRLHFEKGNSISNTLAQEQASIKISGEALVIHEREEI